MMPSVECLREFVNNRLTAAAEEIFGVFIKTIVEYEEEIDRQRKLLDIAWKPEIKLHRIELSQQHVCKEEEALTDQQIFNQERNSSLDQEEPKPPQIKEEQEELCTSQEGEQLVVKVETDDFMVTSTDEETDYSEPERDSDQQLLSNNSDEAESQNQKGELSQQHVCKEEEALTDQQIFNQERNSSLDQEEPKPPQIKEEQEELCTSQEGEQLVVKLETGDFMVTSTDEETDYSEPERDSDQQLLSNNSDEAESQNQKGGEHGDSGSTRDAEPALTIGYHTSESHSHNVNNSNWSEMQHNDLTGKKSFKCDTYGTPVWTSLDQEEPKPPQIIEEQEELFSSQEGEQLVVKLETDDFMLTPAELESDQQLLSNNSDEAESQNQKGGEQGDSGSIRDAEAEPTIRHCNNESHSNKTSMSEIQHNLTGKKPFLCDTCGKCVRSKQSLQLHLRIHTGEKPYSCKTCGKDFRIGNDLKVHMRSHTGEKPYCCNTCGKDFRSSSDLKAHIRSHTGEKPYPCKFCGKSFGHISTLMVHKRIHTGEKPYSCNTCGECFLDISRLKCHMGEHTGEKPFLCNTCGKTFRFRNHFKVHMRSHTGERPYTCTTCGKGFVSGSKLTTHLRSHTGERPYTCTTCGKGFVSSGKLTDHLRSHSGERPHICETCGKGFKRSSHLKTHLKIHTD